MKVSELLDSEEKWTKGAMAADKAGVEKAYWSDDALSWCLLGAVRKCYGYSHKSFEVLGKVRGRIGVAIQQYNDAPTRTFEDVRKLILELDI